MIDVSDPATPVELGSVATPAAVGAAVLGDLALVADRISGLHVIDVSGPAVPVEVGSVDTPGFNTKGVAVSGTLALVANGFSGLRVIDVSDPGEPVEIGFLDTPGFAYGVAVFGTTTLTRPQG